MKKANPPHLQSLATRHSGLAAIQHPKFKIQNSSPVTRYSQLVTETFSHQVCQLFIPNQPFSSQLCSFVHAPPQLLAMSHSEQRVLKNKHSLAKPPRL
jgi:hypothetical protein